MASQARWFDDCHEQSNGVDDSYVNAVKEAIDTAAEKVANDLQDHPVVGTKFNGLSKSGRDAWIAWTWLHRQLVLHGFSVAEALEFREECFERQNDIGTYESMAELLGRLECIRELH